MKQLNREEVYDLSQSCDKDIEIQKSILNVLKTSKDSASILYAIYYFCNIRINKVESTKLNNIFLKFLSNKNESLCVRDISAYALALFNNKKSIDIMRNAIKTEKELMSAFPTFKNNLLNYIDYLTKLTKLKQG